MRLLSCLVMILLCPCLSQKNAPGLKSGLLFQDVLMAVGHQKGGFGGGDEDLRWGWGWGLRDHVLGMFTGSLDKSGSRAARGTVVLPIAYAALCVACQVCDLVRNTFSCSAVHHLTASLHPTTLPPQLTQLAES